MKKGLNKQFLAVGLSLTMLTSVIGFGAVNQQKQESLVDRNIKLYTLTNRTEITDESIMAQIAQLIGEDFGTTSSEYSHLENVTGPVRIYMAMQLNPKIEDGKDKDVINAKFNSTSLVQKVPKNAKYLAIFKITNGVVERVYDENTKTGNGIRELTSVDFDGDYIDVDSTIQFTTDYEITDSDMYAAVYFTNDAGYIGYNLGLKLDEGRVAFSVPNVYYYKDSKLGIPMYIDTTSGYATGETYAIPKIEPVDTMGEYTFLAWMDKQQVDGNGVVTYPARLVEYGTATPHLFNRSSGSIQTLDAIWAYFTVAKEITKYYDGKEVNQEIKFGYSDSLEEKYFNQLDELGVEEQDTVVTWYDENENVLDEAPVNAGSYNQELSKTIILQNGDQTPIERNVENATKVNINKRNVTVSSGSLVKVYDGTPLVDDRIDLITTGDMIDENASPDKNGNGWIIGEGIDIDTIKFTGSQTEIGKSKNSFAYEVNDQTNLLNYDVTENFGILEVKPRYQIEYYYDGVKAIDETKLYEMRSEDVYYEVGDVVELLDSDITKTVEHNGEEYKLSNVANQKLTLTTVDEDNIIKVYYVSKNAETPLTLDNIVKYAAIFLVSIIGIVGIILFKKKSVKKENI